MSVSLCIATYNVLELTKQCFDSLISTTSGLVDEIIVVDDCSTDGTREYLKKLPPPFRVILNESNHGYAYNNNLAARQAKGDILCFLNTDTILQKNWLPPMLAVFKKMKNVGLVGNLQWSPLTKRYDHMGVYFSRRGNSNHFGKGWSWVPFWGIGEWPAVTAACCVVRRDVFLSVNGFDECYKNGREDIDLCLRLGQRGYRHYVAYGSCIQHFVSCSPGRHAYEDENKNIFMERWRERIVSNCGLRSWCIDTFSYLIRQMNKPWWGLFDNPATPKTKGGGASNSTNGYGAEAVGERPAATLGVDMNSSKPASPFPSVREIGERTSSL